MVSTPPNNVTGVLLSGGLDSCILVAHLVEQGQVVQPFYVRSQLAWEDAERAALRQFLARLASPRCRQVVELQLPVSDLYGDHWSLTGRHTPDAASADEEVYLPGRNALLVVKAAIWCQLNGIVRLALAPLGTSPFADTSDQFFQHLQATLCLGLGQPLEIERPFAALDKRRVMQLGRDYPLECTFSCLAPVAGLHCGTCNKCAERRAAFSAIALDDPTRYAGSVAAQQSVV